MSYIGGRETPGKLTTMAFTRFNTTFGFHQLTQTILKRVPRDRKKKKHPNLRNAYLGKDSDNVLTGDFTGDLRSGFGENHKSKSKR